MNRETFTIVANEEGKRLDSYLSEEMNNFSRTRLQGLIKSGDITLNGSPVKPSIKICIGDIIDGSLPPLEELSVEAVNIPLSIVYEDEEIIIINKPKDLVVHPAPGHFNDTLVNGLLYHFQNSLSGINGVQRPGIVHRIDKDTSGLIMVAKTNEAHLSLAAQLKEHSIERSYEAIVFGYVDDKEGRIDEPIGRNPKDRLKMAVNHKSGREAVTRYSVIRHFHKYTHVRLNLETGRTHQIRVHMAHIGHPILGDTVYSPKKQPFNTRGQVLHAKTLGLLHPKTNKFMLFDSELPQYFSNILQELEAKNAKNQ